MKTDTKFYKLLIFVNAFIPLLMLSWDWYSGRIGANPAEFALGTTGVLTLFFLLISLAVTPLRLLTGENSLIRYRRMLGLFAFFYGCLHLTTYSIFDKGLDLPAIVLDVRERPFIALGMAALAILLPLSVTSTNGMVKRLGGKRWRRLHRLVYVAAIFGVAHFYLIQKSDVFWPVVFAIFLVVLFAYRIYVRYAGGRRVPVG